MITWFSAGRPLARRAALGLGLAWFASAPVRAQETATLPAAPPAAAPEPAAPATLGTLGAKARAKQDLAETRLAAARAAAGAGRAAEARALYGQALAAGLAAAAQAFADAEAPRPTSVTSPANEQPVEEPPLPLTAPEDEAASRRAAEEEVARQAAAREALREEARREEALRQAPPVAAPVVVATAPAVPTTSAPATFQVGFRSALEAQDPLDGKHASGGLVFTWLSFARAYGRGAVVVDLESTRWRPGRADTMDRDQVAFYGAGFDWTVPFARAGTGLFVGAEVVGGVLQGSRGTTSVVTNDGVLQVMPHVGGAVAYRGFGLFADAGWRFQLLTDDASDKASVGGVVLQGGLRVEMEPGPPPETRNVNVDAGYAARILSPNGSNIYGRYGGLPGASSGPLLEHELFATTRAFLPPALHMDQGLALTLLSASETGGGPALTRIGFGWLGTWHAFRTRQLFNPYVGLRLGFFYLSDHDVGTDGTFDYTKLFGLVAAGSAGLDVAVHRRLVLRLGVAYDAVAYANKKADASLSGYAVEAGVVVRL